jgi:hypothetical protein
MAELTKRLHAAVAVLVGDGPLKRRLASAYCEHLQDLRPEELPEGLRQDFVHLREMLHRHRPVSGESAVVASVRKLSATELTGLARIVLDLWGSMVRQGAAGERLKVVSPADAPASSPSPAVLGERR